MSFSVGISAADQRALDRILSGIKGGSGRAISAGINKTVKSHRVQSVKAVGKVLNLKAARIKKDFTENRSTWVNLEGSVVAEGKPVGLFSFGATEIRAGVSVKVKRTSVKKVVPGAYIASKGSATHMYRRKYRATNGPSSKFNPRLKYGALPQKYRVPTERLSGPRIEDIYAKDNIFDPLAARSLISLTENILSETQALLRRFR